MEGSATAWVVGGCPALLSPALAVAQLAAKGKQVVAGSAEAVKTAAAAVWAGCCTPSLRTARPRVCRNPRFPQGGTWSPSGWQMRKAPACWAGAAAANSPVAAHRARSAQSTPRGSPHGSSRGTRCAAHSRSRNPPDVAEEVVLEAMAGDRAQEEVEEGQLAAEVVDEARAVCRH